MKASFASGGSSAAADSAYAAVDTAVGVPVSASPKVGRPSARDVGYRIGSRLMLGDLLVTFLSVGVSLQLYGSLKAGSLLVDGSKSMEAVGWSAAAGLLFTLILAWERVYDLRNLYRMNFLLKTIAKSVALWAIVALAGSGVLAAKGVRVEFSVLYSGVALAAGMITWRMIAFTWLLDSKVRASVCSRILVVGWNEKANHLRDSMHRDIGQLGEIIGCVPTPGGRLSVKPPAALGVLGDYSALPSIVRDHAVDTVILSDVSCPAAEIQHLISFCQREYVNFQMVPEYFPALNSSLQVQAVSGVPLLGVTQLPLDKTFNRAIKRAMDVVGALVGLALSSLIVPWFCLLVYLESPGPVIYRQKRTSRSGRNFYIYKIRSMRLNAETGTGAVWCKKEDPRRLRIGSFMRRTNIDELPQFWNVLKGDMSLVGPRPERPELIERFKHEIPNYNVRHKVRAGLTGWAAVNGWRGDTDLSKRVEADLYYLENWSVFLDLYCIFATCFKIKNAH